MKSQSVESQSRRVIVIEESDSEGANTTSTTTVTATAPTYMTEVAPATEVASDDAVAVEAAADDATVESVPPSPSRGGGASKSAATDTEPAAPARATAAATAVSAGEGLTSSGSGVAAGIHYPLTKKMVVDACLKAGYYRTPSCNDKLYLHFKGVDSIGDALEEYTEAKVLWIEGNVLTSLDGVSPCGQTLRQLYAHQNALKSLGKSLEKCVVLDGLNVSDNYLTAIDGLESQVTTLSTLQIKNNKIATVEGISFLPQLQNLRVLDLSNNELDDGPAVLEVLKACPSLRALYLTGNPCVRTMRQYRKTVLAALPELLHLDDKPVFADERRLINAWMRGGVEAEREEREAMRVEEAGAARRRLDDFRRLVYGSRPEDVATADATMGTAEVSAESDEARQRRLADIVGEGSSESEEDTSSSSSDDANETATHNRDRDAVGKKRTVNSENAAAASSASRHQDPAADVQAEVPAASTLEDIDDVYIP